MLTQDEKNKLGKKLFDYAGEGNLEGIKSVLENLENDPDIIDFMVNNKTPIYHASERGNFEIVKFLLEKDANINFVYYRGSKTPIYHASEKGNFEVVKLLLEKGAIVKKGKEVPIWSTPHWIAANKRHNNIVKFFLDRIKFDSDDIADLFRTAAWDCNEQLVEMLLENEVGADLNKCLSAVMDITNDEGYIDCFDDPVAREYHKDLAVLLVESGAGAGIIGGRYGKEIAVRLTENNQNIAALYGIAIKEKDEKYIGLIMEKAIHDEEILEIIKEATNEKNAAFLLYIAAKRGCAELVNTCIKKGGKSITNVSFEYNQTALVVASENGHDKVVELLLENDADIYAVAGRFVDTRGISYWEPHFVAAENNHPKVVKVFLDDGKITVHSESKYGETLLHAAARCGSTEVVKLLLKEGANINAKRSGKYGETPLRYAFEKSKFETAKTLLKYGADSNAEQAKELSGINPEKDLVIENLAAVILDDLKRSGKNLSKSLLNIKIEIKNKLQELLLENPTQNSIESAKEFIERDLPTMLVTIEKTKAASNSGPIDRQIRPVQGKNVKQALKAETKPKKEFIVRELADRMISDFKRSSFITLPEHVLNVIRGKVQDQLRKQLPENPSEYQKQEARKCVKIELQEEMFNDFPPRSDLCSSEVDVTPSKSKGNSMS